MLSALTVDCYSHLENPNLSNPALAVDVEGVNLGSKGEVCLVQIVSDKNKQTPYLIDVFSLGSLVFKETCTFNEQVGPLNV